MLKQNTLLIPMLLASVLLLNGCAAVVLTASVMTVTDRRATGQVIDDNLIESRLMSAIGEHPDLGSSIGEHIRVVCYNSTVLLAGEVKTPANKMLVQQLAEKTVGVERVVNELDVQKSSGFWTRSHDTLLTGKVKTALLGIDIPGFNPSRVKVLTIRDTVYLMGLLTDEEISEVTERTRRVSGVKKVIRIFQPYHKKP